MWVLEMHKESIVGKLKIEVKVKDWRTMGVIGFLFGIVVGTAPQFVGMIILAAAAGLLLKLVDKDRV